MEIVQAFRYDRTRRMFFTEMICIVLCDFLRKEEIYRFEWIVETHVQFMSNSVSNMCVKTLTEVEESLQSIVRVNSVYQINDIVSQAIVESLPMLHCLNTNEKVSS